MLDAPREYSVGVVVDAAGSAVLPPELGSNRPFRTGLVDTLPLVLREC